MEMGTLKFFRLLVPGILIFLLIILFLQNDFHELSQFTRFFSDFQVMDTLYTVIFAFVGVLYYLLGIRNLLLKPYHERVQNNIKDKLISPFLGQLNKEQIAYLKQARRLMNIFYHFIDSDSSLTEKAKRVRFNGLIWTSTVDLTIISVLGASGFWIRLILETTQYNLVMAGSLSALVLISFGLIQLSTKRHLSLSDDQLEMICQKYKDEKDELDRMINEVLQTQSTA